MKAIVIETPGGPEVLAWKEVPDPVPAAGEILVRVRASAMNRADLLQRRGRYPAPPGVRQDVPGLEFAGTVVAAGEGAARWRAGDEVIGLAGGAAHAELVAVPATHCMQRPTSLSWEEAGAIAEAFLTAADALYERARWKAGEPLLIQAAGSGVGLAAAAIASSEPGAAGPIIGLTRSAEKRARLAGQGFTHALDPAAPDLLERIRAASPGGAAVALDLVGASAWSVNLEALAPLGRLVLLGTMGGARIEADLGVIMRRRLTVVGTVLRSRTIEEKAALVAMFETRVLSRLAAGTIRPVVDSVFALPEAARAHARMEANASFGKIVLVQDSGVSRRET